MYKGQKRKVTIVDAQDYETGEQVLGGQAGKAYFKLNKLARALDCGLRSELEIHRYVSLFRDSLGNADFLCPLRKY